MTLQNQVKVWLAIFAVTVLALWLFRGILLPFIVGMGLAYLFDPLADQLEKWKFNRFWATSLIMVSAVAVGAGALLVAVPLVLGQVVGLAERLPGDISRLQELANQWLPEIYTYLGEERVSSLRQALNETLTNSIGIIGGIVNSLMQSGLTIINALGLLVVTPVVAFYLLLDWDRMVKSADDLLPRRHKTEIRGVLRDIDKAMASVIRGQVSVVLLLSAFYAISLSLTGLNFGLAIGLIAGLFSFIPYVGFLIGFLLSIGVATVQFWPDWIMIVVVFGIFIVGQFLEGNVLYPNLVGGSIGVHPVWLMFALFAFGLIFGFVGLLLAVPMAAMASVLARFAVRKYRESELYLEGVGNDGSRSPESGETSER